MQKRLHLIIWGRVQGVFFRHSARLEARRRNFVGWVRNAADGAVEILAEGDEDALKEFLAWVEKGPPLARVDNVQVEWSEATMEFSGFEIW